MSLCLMASVRTRPNCPTTRTTYKLDLGLPSFGKQAWHRHPPYLRPEDVCLAGGDDPGVQIQEDLHRLRVGQLLLGLQQHAQLPTQAPWSARHGHDKDTPSRSVSDQQMSYPPPQHPTH
jgi:hypothetical protein